MASFHDLLRSVNCLRLLAAIGRRAACLAAVPWEEGWERPVADWRRELGIDDPADGEPHGLGTTGSGSSSEDGPP